uniref:Uncharacterized protein n=1 Tax=Knipowitschia caucasica TaxID=637954 RepID=A0AAV2LT68_KNICA
MLKTEKTLNREMEERTSREETLGNLVMTRLLDRIQQASRHPLDLQCGYWGFPEMLDPSLTLRVQQGQISAGEGQGGPKASVHCSEDSNCQQT